MYRNPFNNLRKKFLRCLLISRRVNQNVQCIPLLIHSTPKVMNASVDLEEYFVEMPSVAGARSSATQAVGVGLTELKGPFSDRVILSITPRIANIPSTSRKLRGKRKYSHTIADNLGREAMTMIKREVAHLCSMPHETA
jgi:hypothetical protein